MGRIWTFGDNVDTDLLAPGVYMKGPIEALAAHCLEGLNPDFAASVRPGDIVVGGRNFGMGSSREQAAQALKTLGVAAVLARSFAGIFYRNAFNLGLPALVCDDAATLEDGDLADLDLASGQLTVTGSGVVVACDAAPPHLQAIVAAGGLIPYLEVKFKGAAA